MILFILAIAYLCFGGTGVAVTLLVLFGISLLAD